MTNEVHQLNAYALLSCYTQKMHSASDERCAVTDPLQNGLFTLHMCVAV